jgi:predicted regulator of amino acid metabolism with ACT domain
LSLLSHSWGHVSPQNVKDADRADDVEIAETAIAASAQTEKRNVVSCIVSMIGCDRWATNWCVRTGG